MDIAGIKSLPRIDCLQAAPSAWAIGAHERASAVLLLFIPDPDPDQPARLIFTRRSISVRTHKGQIGLPGGRREALDNSPVATALREAKEEIGLVPELVKVLGCLPLHAGLDRRAIVPIIGSANVSIESLTPNPDEVAELFALPWPLVARSQAENLKFNVFGLWRETPYFPAAGYAVWGLTAWILTQANLLAE